MSEAGARITSSIARIIYEVARSFDMFFFFKENISLNVPLYAVTQIIHEGTCNATSSMSMLVNLKFQVTEVKLNITFPW